MKKNVLILAVATVIALTGVALADGNELAYFRVQQLETLAAGDIANGDYVPVYDASTNRVKKVDATDVPVGGTFTGAVVGTTISASGTVTLDDGSGASPSFVLTDETNESVTFSKVDAGFMTVTTVAGDGVQVTTGNLKVGNGTPGVTQDGEDAYVEGTLEVDGASTLDGALTLPTASLTLTAGDAIVTAGNVTIGNGAPTLTQNGEDFYVEGTLEADGNANLGGTLTVVGASTLNGDLSGDGGDQLVGFLDNMVLATATTITAAQCGSTFYNSGAIEMELPEASTVPGCTLTFVVMNASNFTIDPDAADIILIATNAAGDSLIADAAGESITIRAMSASEWALVGAAYGTWTDSN